MARKSIQYYVFNPGNANAGSIVIPDVYQAKDILMITDITKNAVIYNFSDPTRGAVITYNTNDTTTFPQAMNGTTTITLTANTAVALGYASTDSLQIFVDTPELRVRTHDFGIDAVERQRVAQPESLIDADFEYGMQNTKWATFTQVNSQPLTHEIPGTDVQANVVTGYATLMTADASGNLAATGAGGVGPTGTTMKLLNQGFTAAAVYIGNTSPQHFQNDYKIIINQPLGASHPVGTTQIANSALSQQNYTAVRYITQANGGAYQRSFTVGTVANYNVGDLAVIVGIPQWDTNQVSTTAVTTGVTALTANSTSIPAGSVLAIETSSGGVFELVAVNAGGGTASLGITRGLLGTNPGGLTLPVGARIKQLVPSATPGFESNLEIVRIDTIDSINNTFTVTRGFMNTNASVQFLPGSIVAKVNMATPLSPNLGNGPAGTGGNIEIVMSTTPAVNFNGTQGIRRAQLGTTAIASAPAGSLVVTAAGIFMAGNVQVPVIGVNANAHGVASATFGANVFNGAYFGANNTSWAGVTFAQPGSANANAYVSTTGINNANIEGVFFNTINDTNYIAYFPKVWPNRDVGYPFTTPSSGSLTDVVVRKGALYTGANIAVNSIVSNTGSPSTITITTLYPHGLMPGQLIQTHLYGSTNANTHASGVFVINSVPYNNQFTFVSKTGAAVANAVAAFANIGSTSLINGNVVLFASSLVRHRPLDGGTNLGVNSPGLGYDVVRQTKKYFRYQSGKGLMFTTGISLAPVATIVNVVAGGTSIGSTITITTEFDHGLQTGANINVTGYITSGYNTNFRVSTVTAQNQFTVLATQVLGATVPTIGDNPKYNTVNWHGSKVQMGLHDDQNGVFWEYDGANIKVGKRSATRDLAGRVSIGVGSQIVTGDANSRFQDQILAGDVIVIRGMSHTVSQVESQATMYVTPPFKGIINAVDVKYSIVDIKYVPQSQFMLDRLDGTGPSGYVITVQKMQMIAIQYTWYGAGFIDYGVRATDGKFIWAHRIKNNNVNDEAWMRSGNMPARYRMSNFAAYSGLKLALVSNETGNINLNSVADFPTATSAFPISVIIEAQPGTGQAAEIVTYSAGPFTANGNICQLTRANVITYYNAGQYRSMSMGVQPIGSGSPHNVNASVRVFSLTATPDLNHWGAAVILDGGFTKDRSYNFTYVVANTNVLGTQTQTLFMMRLAPSLTNAITGDLGVKDLINRAQLQLQNIFVNIANNSATLSPRFLIQAILNPTNILSANWVPLNNRTNSSQTAASAGSGGFNQPSFTQFCANVYPASDKPISMWGVNQITWDLSPRGQHNGQPYAQGGEQLFSIPVSATNSGFIDLSTVKEIGGAVLPGTGFYPNGNEILAFNIVPAQGSQANVDIQIQYVESQA
jgi:hypothetical protein